MAGRLSGLNIPVRMTFELRLDAIQTSKYLPVKKHAMPGFMLETTAYIKMERETGFEPATSSLEG